MLPAYAQLCGDRTQGEGRSGRRARNLDGVTVRIMEVGRLRGRQGSTQVAQAGMQRRSRQGTGQGHREQGRCEGEQEPVRARESKGRLGPGQKCKTQKASTQKHVLTNKYLKASLRKAP